MNVRDDLAEAAKNQSLVYLGRWEVSLSTRWLADYSCGNMASWSDSHRNFRTWMVWLDIFCPRPPYYRGSAKRGCER